MCFDTEYFQSVRNYTLELALMVVADENDAIFCDTNVIDTFENVVGV